MADLKTIDDLAAAPYNPRTIGKKAADGLAKSLKMFEDVSGIVWNKRTGHLVTGHQRVAQLRQLGAEIVDGALVAGKKRWPIRVVDWPIAKEKAANIAANNPHVAGEFSDGLGDILTDIKLSIGDVDFAGLRFDELGLGIDHAPLHESVQSVGRQEESEFYQMPEWLAAIWENASRVVVIYSGGMDSTAAALWAHHHRSSKDMCLCFSDTGVEFPGMGDHIAAVAGSLSVEHAIVKPDAEWWSYLRKEGRWPSMLWPRCQIEFVYKPTAHYVKNYPAADTVVITGTHGAEAIRGSKKTERSELYGLKKHQHFAPCFGADKSTITEVVAVSGIPVWDGYARGFARTACWCCPKQQSTQALALEENYPGLANDIRRWETRLGPIQPSACPGGQCFDDLVVRGRRMREKAKSK